MAYFRHFYLFPFFNFPFPYFFFFIFLLCAFRILEMNLFKFLPNNFSYYCNISHFLHVLLLPILLNNMHPLSTNSFKSTFILLVTTFKLFTAVAPRLFPAILSSYCCSLSCFLRLLLSMAFISIPYLFFLSYLLRAPTFKFSSVALFTPPHHLIILLLKVLAIAFSTLLPELFFLEGNKAHVRSRVPRRR